jgi:hypothetical protein
MIPNTIERSDAGTSIVQELFGFVKRNLSEARRREKAASGVKCTGAAALVPAQLWRDPERDQRTDSQLTGLINTTLLWRFKRAATLLRAMFMVLG